MPLTLHMVGLIVADIPRAVAFYRHLGLDIPAGSEARDHVEIRMNGMTFFLSSRESNRRWDPVPRAEPRGGYRAILEFLLDSCDALEAKYAELTGLGYASHSAPNDVSDELRFAMVDDPDGNTILLSAIRRRALTGSDLRQ